MQGTQSRPARKAGEFLGLRVRCVMIPDIHETHKALLTLKTGNATALKMNEQSMKLAHMLTHCIPPKISH